MTNKYRKIRVLHIITRLIPGGADENTIQTVVGLDKSRFNVDLVAGGQSDTTMISRAAGCRVILMPDLIREPALFRDLKTFWQLTRLIRKEHYHIVHTHTAKAGILGRLAAVLARTPVIVHTLHGVTFHRTLSAGTARLYRILERLAARVTHKLVTVGDHLREIYLAAGIGEEKQYITIRSGFELARFKLSEAEIALRRRKIRREMGLPESACVIGSASRLEPRKGQYYFLEAAQRLLQDYPALHFIIAGAGPSAQELRTLAHSLRIDRQVHFLGHRTDIEDVMATMDIFVLSSLWEGLPQVLVQAASLGKPIVCFDTEGACEVVHGGENGFIVPRGDVSSMTEALFYLLAHPQQARLMGLKGHRFVGQDYDRAVMVKKIETLYNRLIKRSGPGFRLSRRTAQSVKKRNDIKMKKTRIPNEYPIKR